MCLLNFVLFFQINYKCQFGQSVYVLGNVASLGSWDVRKAIKLSWAENHNWTAKHKLTHDNTKVIEYKYFVGPSEGLTSENQIQWEEGGNRKIDLESSGKLFIRLKDEWARRKVKLGLQKSAIKGLKTAKFKIFVEAFSEEFQSYIETKLKKYTLDGQINQEFFITESLDISAETKVLKYRFIIEDLENHVMIPDRKIRKLNFQPYLQNSNSHSHIFKKDKLIRLDHSFAVNLNFDMITPNIYVGAVPMHSVDVKKLAELGINSVLNLQTDNDTQRYSIDMEAIKKNYEENNIEMRQVQIIDLDNLDLSNKIAKAANVMKELADNGKKVYVHCTAGINRSPNVVIYYLWQYHSYELREAMKLVKTQRSKINVYPEVFC